MKSKLVSWFPWLAAAVLTCTGGSPAAGAPAKANRGVATFVHGAEAAAAGGELPLVLVVYGFTQLTEAAPLPGAQLELAWQATNIDAGEVAARTKPLVARTDEQGAALVTMTAPHGLGPWKLLVRTRFGEHERTDELDVKRAEAQTLRLSQSVTSARPGASVHAWAEVDAGGHPVGSERVRFEVLEGNVSTQSVWVTTDAAGRADTEFRLPKGDALLTGWTLSATTDRGSNAQASVQLRDDTPTEAKLLFDTIDPPPRAGGALRVTGRMVDATGAPVQNTEIQTWTGPENLAVAAGQEKWKTLSNTSRTDASGRFRIESTMPALVGRAGLTWLTRVVAVVAGERIAADHTEVVDRTSTRLRLLPPGEGLLPGFQSDLLLVAEGGDGKPVENVELRLEGDGLRQSVRTNARGEAVVGWKVPAGVGTTRQVEPCSGGVAANVAVIAGPSALAAGFPARSDLCIPVDRDARTRVTVDPPMARAGDPIRIVVEEPGAKAGAPSPRAFSLVAQPDAYAEAGSGVTRTALAKNGVAQLSTAGLAAGSYTLSAIGVSRVNGKDQPALGRFLVVPARLPRPQATLRSTQHVPNGHATIAMKLIDERGAPFVGTVGAIVTERRFDAQDAAVSMDVRQRYCSDAPRRGLLRCDDIVTPEGERQKLAPAYLAEAPGKVLRATQDPMHSAKDDAKKTFAEVVRSLEGALYEASGSRDTLQDVLRKEGGKNDFNPELLTLAVQSMGTPPLTPGGAPVALADLVSLDPQVDYDHVARRVARFKLFKVLDALRTAQADRDPGDVSFDEPNAALRRLLAAGTIEESLLLDPWGGTMAFVRVAEGKVPSFLTPKRGFELRAPGPDGKLGTADDVKGPFERVLRSGSPYAIATDEDKVVDAQFEVTVAQSSVDQWRSVLEAATGTVLGGELDLRGASASGGGYGSGHGALRGGHTAHGVRLRSSSSGYRALVAPRAAGADGTVTLEVPLGPEESTYRVLLVADVPGLGRLVESVDVDVALQRSIRVKTSDRWLVGDTGDISVVVENRGASPATLDIRAEGSTNLTLGALAPRAVTVAAHGRTTLPFRVGTPRAGIATLRLALREAGRLVDRYEGSWTVSPAGEPVTLAEAAWVRASTTIARPAAAGHVGNGDQVLSLQANGSDVLRAALLSVEPARLRDRRQAEDARALAVAVQHHASAHDDKVLGTLAGTVHERALGRATVLPALPSEPKGSSHDGCPQIPAARLFRDDPSSTEPEAADKKAKKAEPGRLVFGSFEATAQCFDLQINQRVEELLAMGDTIDIARAILELAEHEPREPLAVALTLELRRRVKLTPSGRMTPPDRQNHAERALVFAALLRGANTSTSTSRIDAAALVPWLLVEQDAHGSFGSVEATAAAVRALVASGTMGRGKAAVVEVETSAGTNKVRVEATGAIRIPLPPDGEPVRISVQGAPVLARIVAPTLRSYQAPPLPPMGVPEVRVDWPEAARVNQDARLSVRVAPRSNGRNAELRIPLPPNVELAVKPSNGTRLIDHVLRIPVPKVGLATQLGLRVVHGGRFTVPEGGLYEGGDRLLVVPARPFVVR